MAYDSGPGTPARRRGLPLRTRQYLGIVDALAEELPSMAAVARRLGVSRSYLSRLTSGKRGVIGDATITHACAALGLPRHYFDNPAWENVDYRAAPRAGAPESADGLTMMTLTASAESLAHHATLVLDALNEGAPLDRSLRHLVSSARATLYLESHEVVVGLLSRQAPEAELRAAAKAYATAMRHLGTLIARASDRTLEPDPWW